MPGYSLDSLTSTKCEMCTGNCAECSGPNSNQCTSCFINFTPSSGSCLCNTPGYKLNTLVQPNTCESCPAECQSCSSPGICDSCVTEFRLENPSCICKASEGFMLQTTTDCRRCTKGCVSCLGDVNTCSGGSCRQNYVDYPNCTCPVTSGFREDDYPAIGWPKICEPCPAGCHSCTQIASVCSGCRPFFLLSGNTCVCLHGDGFR